MKQNERCVYDNFKGFFEYNDKYSFATKSSVKIITFYRERNVEIIVDCNFVCITK